MITTEEYWDIDGTALNTLAWNIETLSGRISVPQLRGENIAVPYRAGRVWRPKTPDSRIISLAMYVLGCDADGRVPETGTTRRAEFNQNMDALQRLYYRSDRQLQLTKRWRMDSGLLSAVALAEPASEMQVAMMGRFGGRMVLDLLLADPFFYGTQLNPTIAKDTPTNVLNAGHERVTKMTIRFNGPLTNPVLTNSTPTPDIAVSYTGVIGGGEWVELDTDLFTAVDDGAANVIAGVDHDGSLHWMELLAGVNNSLTLTASSGSGNVTVTYKPPYV